MAKTTNPQNSQEGNQPIWTPEDVTRLSGELDALGARFNATEPHIKTLMDRLTVAEGSLALLDPTKAALPAQLTRHIDLGTIYTHTVVAGFQALLIRNARVLDDAKFRRQELQKCVDLAELLVDIICDKYGVDFQTKAK